MVESVGEKLESFNTELYRSWEAIIVKIFLDDGGIKKFYGT